MAGEDAGEIGSLLRVQGGDRHKDRLNPEEELITRLIQVIDSYATRNNISAAQARTIAIDGLVKKQAGFN